jgi:hypothetical protein
MNTSDSRKLTDAIEALTRQLRSGGTGPSSPSSPSSNTPSSSSPGQYGPMTPDQAAAQARRSFEEDMQKSRQQEMEFYETRQRFAEIDSMTDDARLERVQKILDAQEEGVQLTSDERRELSLLQKSEADRAALKVRYAKKDLEMARKQRKAEEDLLDPVRERVRLLDDTEDAVKNVFSGLIKTSKLKPDPKRGVAGFLRSVTFDKEAREEALETFHKQVADFKSLLTPINLTATAFEGLATALMSAVTLGFGAVIRAIQAAIEFVVAMVMQFDALGAEIAKTTGHGRVFADQIVNLSYYSRQTSIDIGEMTKSITSLSNTLTGVNGISLETVASLAEMGHFAERMGVSMEVFGNFMKDAMVGGGLSAEEAKQSFSNLNKAAELMNVNFSELSSEFMSSRTTFSAYGQNMEKVFLRTSSVARQMGVELGSVLGMSDKFKTFEDSAGFVSEFNHMVGASLDPLEMMRLRAQDGPDAVAKALQDSLKMSGKSFDELSYSMREGISDSLGIPMNELRNMMESDVDISLADEVENASQPMDIFLQKGKETFTILERIGELLKEVAITFAMAFGLDKFAGQSMSEMFESLEGFVRGPFADTIMKDFAPFVKVDLPSMIKTLSSFVKSIINSPTIQELLGVDPLEQKREEYAELGKQLKNTGDTSEIIKIQKQMSALKEEYNDQATDMSLAQNIMSFGGLNPFAAGIFTLSNMMTKKDISAMPGQADGGPVLKGGLAMVGERGPEVVSMPTGAYTIPNNAFARTGSPHSNSSSTSGGGQPVQVNVRIDANDRVLKNAFTTTVEDVITGGA